MVGPSPSAAAETHTYASLVRRLMDLERLAVLPADGETCQQWSSYDRASRYDVTSGKYVAWDANGDGGQFIRQEGETQVMAEMKGPGCIWRIWSATAEQGHVKIYLDGQQEPAVDLPFQEYFTGKSRPFAYPGLSYQLADVGSRGHNLYVPIPYQKSCKVVAEKGWGAYYHIVYSTFPAGTQVPTFRVRFAAGRYRGAGAGQFLLHFAAGPGSRGASRGRTDDCRHGGHTRRQQPATGASRVRGR